ncbi:MAG TPA: T9SS type A sorting domain-containing protein, partial [Candidatus Kapabacteria bacterium]|nr:T9SS type A sorting domain-containing protein [Candidatus Kapabacteria bacterium]
LDWSPISFYSHDNIVLAGVQLYTEFLHQFVESPLFRSTNAGVDWMPDTNGIFPGYYLTSFTSDGKNIYAGTDAGIYVSTDDGLHWNMCFTFFGYGVTSMVSNDSDILAGYINGYDYFGVMRSVDNGISWFSADSGLRVDDIKSGLLTVCNHNVFVAMGDTISVYKTTNNGEYWSYADSGLPRNPNGGDSAVTAFGVIGDTIFTVVGNNSFYRSTNNGDLWEPVATIGFPANVIINTLFAHSGVLFAGTSTGFYYSLDHGSSWIYGSEGLPSGASVGTLSATNEYLYAGISNGVYRRPLSDFGINAVNEKQTTLPTQLSLSQNYPNPFSGETTISYSLPTPERITLSVYNSLGEEVATLVSDKQSAGGHNVVFKSDQLQNGMYFYRIVAGMDVQSGKMIVLKK